MKKTNWIKSLINFKKCGKVNVPGFQCVDEEVEEEEWEGVRRGGRTHAHTQPFHSLA